MASNNNFLRMSNAGIQMGIAIGGFAWLGHYIDEKNGFENKIFTVILALLGVAIGLYIVIKAVMNISKNDGNDKK